MSELKKLFRVKRILAMVLAVTLAVTSAPVTAQAAPGDISEQTETDVEDISTEEKEAEPGEEPADENADVEASETAPTDTDVEASETAPTDTDTETSDSTEVDAGAGTSETPGTGDQVQEDEEQGRQTADDAVAENAADAESGDESPSADVQADTQGVRKAEITFGRLRSLEAGDITVDYDSENQSATVTTTYSDEDDNPFKDIVNSLKNGTDDRDNYYVRLSGLGYGDAEYDPNVLRGQLVYTWQQKDGTPMGASAPVNAGEYRLEISIDRQLVDAEAKYIDFVIKKADLYIKTDATQNLSGKTVGEVKEIYAEAMGIAPREDADMVDRYLQFVAAADKSVVTVSDPLGAALTDTDVLKQGGDYLVEIAPALKTEYQANYELHPFAENIVITDLVSVSLAAQSDLEPGKDITYPYGEKVMSPIDTAAAADKKVTVKITIDGVTDEATGEAKELPVVLEGEKKNIAGVWLDANKAELEEGKAPTDAGVYYYKLIYTDPDGVYGVDTTAEDYEDCLVKVVVEPAKLAVKPALDDKKTYQKGTAVNELLKDVSYKLFEKDEAGAYTKEFSVPAEEKDTFWGVSYNNPAMPQYYEPVFKVQKRVTTTTTYTDTTKATTTVEGEWTNVTKLDEVSGETKETDKTVKTDVEYRVVFAGQKGLYKDGVALKDSLVDINKQIDINSANRNYDVDVTKEVLEANAAPITVNNSTEVTINTEDIVNNIQDMTLAGGVYTKRYDEKAPFADRSKYKQAKTDNAEADKAGSFTYTWYGFDMVDKLDDKGEIVKDAEGNPVQEPVCDGEPKYNANNYDLARFANAGRYCLRISYEDPTNTYTAKPAYLFFEIEGKLLKVVLNADPKLKAYTGGSVSEFTDRIAEQGLVTYQIMDGETDLTETLKQLDQEINAADKDAHLYDLTWVVLEGDNTDPAKAVYSPKYDGEFTEGLPYKLGVELTFRQNSVENKYYDNYTNEKERDKTDPIQHNWNYDPLDVELGIMSDVELNIKFDNTKIASFKEEYNGEEHFKVADLISAGYVTVTADNNPDQLLTIGSGEGQVPLEFKWQKYDSYEDEGITNPVNAGEYRLTVSYPGDEKYAAISVNTYDAGDTFTINPKELTIEVKAALKDEEITAGWDMSLAKDRDRLFDRDGLTVTGYIEADKEAFAGGEDGKGLVKDAPVLDYSVVVEKEGDPYKNYLRFGESYTVGVDAWLDEEAAENSLKDKEADNYKINVADAAFSVGKRGNSTVQDARVSHADDVSDASKGVRMHVKASVADDKVTVAPVSGICYFYNNTLGIPDEKFVPGNYLIFEIVAPKEFDANGRVDENWEENEGDYTEAFRNFVYENSIEGTGKGYVLEEGTEQYNGTIRVAFPVTKEDQSTARNFTILWEKLNGVNYTEEYTVDMTEAQLEDDLRTAVAPKTLAFNGVNTKMTVGETQQLDVKMTKVLNSDVVFLNYEVAAGSEKFASVTRETGVVTALSKGKATINVYPVRRNDKGEVERIPESEFKKVVKTTITINDVTAPKINSVYAYDNHFELKYTKPADGYRREVYVFEGKNRKANELEELVKGAQAKGMNKLDELDGLAAWRYADEDTLDRKTNVVTMDVDEIEPATEYTVYVRNVSGVRTLDDGSLVVASAQGSVKSFKTTKTQLQDIKLIYRDETEEGKLTPEGEEFDDCGIDEIDLSEGSVQLTAMGKFSKQVKEGAADPDDYDWEPLPTDKRDTEYETQKLTFYAVERPWSASKEDKAKYKNTYKDYKTLIGDEYYIPSSIAKIDKNGKLTLKGIGFVYIIAYDSVSGASTLVSKGSYGGDGREVTREDGYYALHITSEIDKITAKSITLKVGSSAIVYPSITFYSKNKKLPIGKNTFVNIPLCVKPADSTAVEVVDDKEVNYNGCVIAKEPGQTVDLTVYLKDNPSVETTLTVKTKPIDPVKSVKAVDVIDDSATLTFTHTANENYEVHRGNEYVKFKIDLKDNRQRLISSHMETLSYRGDKSDTAKGVYFYEYDLDGLKRQSVYNVTVTPFYGGQTAKAASSKFTTTNIPAYREDFVEKDEDGKLLEGGMPIYIDSVKGYDENNDEWRSGTLEDIGYLTSGNSYTLIADADPAAKNRKTDTLTWKSTNSKVASVKANVGSYTATLKASSVGSTYIEVTSKITKKVIARYIVRVKSVSNGGQGAYGDTEPKNNIAWDPEYDQGIEVLTEKNPVKFATPMAEYDYRWISFTAPADGLYTLGGSSRRISGYYYKTDFPGQYDGGKKENFNENDYSVVLDEGDTIYLKACGTTDGTAVVTVTAQKYGKLTASGSVSVAGLGQVEFTASEDNYYTFYASESGKQAYCEVKDENNVVSSKRVSFTTEAEGATDSASVGVKKGQTVRLSGITAGDYTISVKGRTYEAFGTNTGSLADDGKGSAAGKWYAFEVKAAGEYTFTVSPDKAGAMGVRYFADVTKSKDDYTEELIPSTAADGKETLSITKSLNEGDRIAVYVYATGAEAVSADVGVSQPKAAEVSLAANTGELTVENGKPVWVSFKVPEKEKEYCFSYAVETGKSVDRTYYQNDVNTPAYIYQGTDRFTSAADDKTIYIRLATSDDSAKVTVSVKETAAAAVTVGQDAPFEVTLNSKQFFTFTAPKAGLYEIKAALKEESKDKSVDVVGAYKVSQSTGTYSLGENGVRKFLAGETVTIAVSTLESDAVKGDLKVTEVTVDVLEAKGYTLATGETKRFKYTPDAAGKYLINYSVTGETPTVTWGSSLDSMNSFWGTGMFDLSAGEVVYIKAVNNGTAESKITFTITPADQPLPTDGKISVKAGSPVTYKYVVKQVGRYKVTYTADPADANPTVNYEKTRTSIASGEEISCPTKGETVTFTVSADKDATVTLNMDPIVPGTALEASVAKNGGVQWFEYTAPATGRYTVALTDNDGKEIAADVSAEYAEGKITNSLTYGLYSLNETWFNKGDKYYVKVTNNGTADQAVKIAFTPITASEDLAVGAEPKTVSLKAGDVKWYRMNLDEAMYYTFTLENASAVYFADKDNYGDDVYSGTRYLAKGTYFVKVSGLSSAAEAVDAKIGVKKETVQNLEEGKDLSISFDKSGTQYVKFTPSKTAWYAFRLKDVPEDVSSVSVYGGGINLSKDKVYAYSRLTVAQPLNISVYLDFPTPTAEGEKKTVKLFVEEIKPGDLVSDLSVTVEKGAMSWFTFKAHEAGYYNFTEDSKDVEVKYKSATWYDDSLWFPYDSTYGAAFPAEMVYLEKDAKLTFGVFYDGLKSDATVQEVPASATFKVTAKQVPMEELSLNTQKTITFSENEKEKWYSFKPEFRDEYVFIYSGTEGKIKEELYRSGELVGDSSEIDLTETKTVEKTMYGGWTYFLKISSDSPLSFQMEVRSKTLDGIDITSAEKIGVGETREIMIDGGYKLFEFSAPEADVYTFYTVSLNENGEDTYGTLFDSNLKALAEDDDGAYGLNFGIVRSLAEGQTVYLKVNELDNGSLYDCAMCVSRGKIDFPEDVE